MGTKRHEPEDVLSKLRQVEVLVSQGQSIGDAIRSIDVTDVTESCMRKKFGGLKSERIRRMTSSVTGGSRSVTFATIGEAWFVR